MITSYAPSRIGDVVTVRVTSDLVGTVFFHWYRDGAYLGYTSEPQRTFQVAAGDQVEIDCLDTLDSAFDPIANSPVRYPARKTLFWLRSLDVDVNRYRIDESQDGGDWSTIGEVLADPNRWTYTWLTDRLADLSTYAFRVVPIDLAGNPGTPIELPPELLVRRPDAPSYAVTFDPGTTRVTFGNAE
jgi:hypothetical protein